MSQRSFALALAAVFGAVHGSATDHGAFASRTDSQDALVLLAHDGENFAPAGALKVGGPPVVLALATRQTVQPRSVARRDGHTLRVPLAEAGPDARLAVEVLRVAHPEHHFVLWAEDPTADLGPALYRIAPVELPRSAARGDQTSGAGASALPALARADGVVETAPLWVDPGTDRGDFILFTIGGTQRSGEGEPSGGELRLRAPSEERPWLTVHVAAHSHLLVPAPAAPFIVEGSAALDGLQIVNAAPVPAADGFPLEELARRTAPLSNTPWQWRRAGLGSPVGVPAALRERGRERFAPLEPGTLRAGMLELLFRAPPAAPEGETYTLVARATQAQGVRGVALIYPAVQTPRFAERAAELGLRAVHFEGPDLQLDIRPTMGPGMALGDVNGDGLVDLYLVQGGGREGSEVEGNRLFLNRTQGAVLAFVDGSRAGARDTGHGMGALFFDGDGDGRLDLYVANYGTDSLWHNRAAPDAIHGFEFVDQSAQAGLVHNLWSAGVAAGDPDRDGDLDLYVASYLEYDPAGMPDAAGAFLREDPPAMLPYAFPGQRNVYLRNESTQGSLRFVDATLELDIVDAQGRGMQPVFFDFDRDGWTDLYVANDVSINRLFHNLGDGRLRDVAFAAGMDDPRGGMGVAVGDVDGDGDEDLVLTNWQLESNALYINHLWGAGSQRTRVPSFRDLAIENGIGRPSLGVTGWGVVLEDLDGDGDLDLAVANGYTSPDYESTGICVGQPCHMFENDGEGSFAQVDGEWAPDFARRNPWRALGACDFAQNGALDLVVTANNGPTAFFENTVLSARWIGVRLRGAGKNTHGIGAEVTVVAGPRILRRSLVAGTSYLVGNAPELWFGLGELEPEHIEVRWTSGARSTHPIEGINRFVVIEEPAR